MKRYFSSESAHGSSTSHGFCNDTIVYCFNSKIARDTYVNESNNISCKAIPFWKVTREATSYSLTFNRTNAPKPFSGEYWAIVNNTTPNVSDYSDLPNGCIGTVECCTDHDYGIVERLYK